MIHDLYTALKEVVQEDNKYSIVIREKQTEPSRLISSHRSTQLLCIAGVNTTW